ncbi:H-NS family nucleoid-associated regulatory protein [Paraburkholderia sp. WSM4175]|uniref:H-NS family nucleoid-associated regulatory protein n=1 Tax=Paraburkholderia sp. WSM4175 TaxID=2991072 RepID=UPI003D1E6950
MLIPKARPRGQVEVVRRPGLPAKDRGRFLVSGSVQYPATKRESGKRVSNYIRGPQSTKYPDPKTGATWRGRGRAPAWLADVRDRSVFLTGCNVSASKTANSAKRAAAR